MGSTAAAATQRIRSSRERGSLTRDWDRPRNHSVAAWTGGARREGCLRLAARSFPPLGRGFDLKPYENCAVAMNPSAWGPHSRDSTGLTGIPCFTESRALSVASPNARWDVARRIAAEGPNCRKALAIRINPFGTAPDLTLPMKNSIFAARESCLSAQRTGQAENRLRSRETRPTIVPREAIPRDLMGWFSAHASVPTECLRSHATVPRIRESRSRSRNLPALA